MFDIGWPEFLVILVVALIVIGPRDLPGALKQVGRWVRSARKVAREFQRHVDDAMRDTELEDLKKGLDATRKFNVKRQIEKFVDPDDELSGAEGAAARKQAVLAKKEAARQADTDAGTAVADGAADETRPAASAATPDARSDALPDKATLAKLDPNDPQRRLARQAAAPAAPAGSGACADTADEAGPGAADEDVARVADGQGGRG